MNLPFILYFKRIDSRLLDSEKTLILLSFKDKFCIKSSELFSVAFGKKKKNLCFSNFVL